MLKKVVFPALAVCIFTMQIGCQHTRGFGGAGCSGGSCGVSMNDIEEEYASENTDYASLASYLDTADEPETFATRYVPRVRHCGRS